MPNPTDEIKQPGTTTVGELPSGQLIGRYRVISLLGRGGMGEVYLAHDTWLKRNVALKMLPRNFALEAASQAQLEHEAQMLAAFSHPNIAAIYDLVQVSGWRCLVLEFVKGETLDERLLRKPLAPGEALPIFSQIARALDAAHRAGIVHRDLKPLNIRITPEGMVKILDFGIAKLFKNDTPTTDLSRQTSLAVATKKATLYTDNGKIIGTPQYMSPEQTYGKPIDHRTDIWAFGCVMYEALSGRLAFDGAPYEAITAVRATEPDWQALPQTVPRDLRELIRQCLQKDPALRPRSAAEIWHRLEAVRRAGVNRTQIIPLQPLAPKEPDRQGRANKRLLAPLLAALVLSLAAWALWKNINLPQPPAQKYLAIVPFKQLGGQTSEDKLLANGLLRQLSQNLAKVAGLQLIRNLPPPDKDNRWVVEHLGATLILRGSVQRAANQLQIGYTLLDAGEKELLNQTVKQPDLLSALNEVSAQVTQALGLSAPVPAPTLPITMQDGYLVALGHLADAQENQDVNSVTTAIGLLGQIVNQPAGDQAPYHAALARAYLIKYDLTRDKAWLAQARNACERAASQDQQAQQIQLALGEVNLALKRPSEAALNFQRVLQQRPDSVAAKLGQAAVSQMTNQPYEAESSYRQAIALAPNFWLSHNEFGNFYFEIGRYQQAAERWETVVKLVPAKDDGHTNLGHAYLFQGKLDEAIASYRQSLDLRQSPEAYSGLGTAFYFQGKYREAVDEFKKGLELNDAHPVLLGNLGDAYRQLPDRIRELQAYDQAIQSWQEEGVEEASETADAVDLARLAEIMAKRGRAADALSRLRSAEPLASQKMDFMASAIIVYELTGNRSKALQWANRAVQNGYSTPLLKLEPLLRELRNDPQFNQIINR